MKSNQVQKKYEYLSQIGDHRFSAFESLLDTAFQHFSCLECLSHKYLHSLLYKQQMHHVSNVPKSQNTTVTTLKY